MTSYRVASTARRAPGGAAFVAADGTGSVAVPSGVLHAYLGGEASTVCGIPVSTLQTFDETSDFSLEATGHGCVTCLDAVA